MSTQTTCDQCGEVNPADIHTCTPPAAPVQDQDAYKAGFKAGMEYQESVEIELLEALDKYVTAIASGGGGDKDLFMAAIREADNAARAAIEKATGGKA